ncbi:putative MFS monocarboxylate transporter [Lineolata rhizophorae]|uniref:Putative MFS monocarboxylate transporter n=1 Tax=Lineolata rhizophorae TaxID=578093 RepID=A0A6A6NUB3_9PEZI|nr:putative MFS monocarboxylate transporter [Lineolata rhizophorae]
MSTVNKEFDDKSVADDLPTAPNADQRENNIQDTLDGDARDSALEILKEKESDEEEPQQQQQQPEEKKPTAPPGINPADFPDGGLKAWLVVVGGFCCLFCSFGWINCVGVYQNYYESNQLSDLSSSTVSWIPSLEIFFMFFGGPFFGKLIDEFGPRYVLLVGSFFHIFGLMMTSLADEYYQFILAQGVCSPIGASMIFYCAMASIPTWFFRRRALAFGIIASGSSIGGVVMPIMVQHIIPEVGFAWSMRITAFLILFLMTIANLTVRSRLPPQPKPFNILEFITPFAEIPFVLLSLGAVLFFFGMFLPINYIIVYGLQQGMSANLAQYLVPILNAWSIIGRVGFGHVGDKLGRFNVMITLCSFTAIMVLALWIPGSSNATTIVFASAYGLGSGTFVSMLPALIAQISDVRKIGVRNGSVFALISIAGLTSNPIGGAIMSSQDNDFLGLQIFCGVMQCAGTLSILASRVSLAGFDPRKKV